MKAVFQLFLLWNAAALAVETTTAVGAPPIANLNSAHGTSPVEGVL